MIKSDTANRYKVSGNLPLNLPLCLAPALSIRFNHSGNIIACCFNRKYILGRYPKNSINEIWFGEKAQQLRNAIYNNDLSKGSLSADQRTTKESQLLILQNDLSENESAINALDYKRDSDQTNNESQLSKNRDDIFQLDATRLKRETTLVQDLREAYDDKIEILNDAINSRKMAITGAQGSYALAVGEGDKALKEIDRYIGSEQIRIADACSMSQCGCFPVGPSPYLRWNQGMQCVGTLDFHGQCFYDSETQAMYDRAIGVQSSGSVSNGDRNANRGQAKLSRAVQSIADDENK